MKRFLQIMLWGFALLVLFIVVCNFIVYTESKVYIYYDANEAPKAEVALVPGAALSLSGELSSVFKARVNSAIALYKAGKVSKILVSGDNSTLSHNEVNPARLYLIEKGVPDKDIFLDHAGFDTYSSMYRARDIFKVTSLIVTTQSFHIYRSVFIARHLGIESYGVRADIPNLLFRNYVREALAQEKAILDLVLKRTPKFLGDIIPITGDGRESP